MKIKRDKSGRFIKGNQIRLGAKLTKETIQKEIDTHKGKHYSPATEFKKGHPSPKAMLGKYHTKETKIRIGVGVKNSEKYQIAIKSLERIRKISDANKGEKNPAWIDGRTKENNPYSIDWTETLRRSIRERDHYTCQLCGKLQGDRAHSVHHIDYDKKNCNPDNLITLCNSCNVRVNYNREYWKNYFIKL